MSAGHTTRLLISFTTAAATLALACGSPTTRRPDDDDDGEEVDASSSQSRGGGSGGSNSGRGGSGGSSAGGSGGSTGSGGSGGMRTGGSGGSAGSGGAGGSQARDAAVVDAAAMPDAQEFDAPPPDMMPDTPPPPPIAAPWTVRSIGMPAAMGEATYTLRHDLDSDTEIFTISASGMDIGGVEDAFHFVYQELQGDGEIVARIRDMMKLGDQTKVGIMLRTSMDRNAANVFLAAVGDGGTGVVQIRETNGGATVASTVAAAKTGTYLRLQRKGNAVIPWTSTDLKTWTPVLGVADNTTVPPMPRSVPLGGMRLLVGLAVSGNSAMPAMTAIANFNAVRITNIDPAEQGPSGWAYEEVGLVGGRATLTGSSATITAYGDNTKDFNKELLGFVYRTVPPLFTDALTVKVDQVQSASADARAGITFRAGATNSLRRRAPHAMISAGSNGTVYFQSRNVPMDGMDQMVVAVAPKPAPQGRLPVWLRMARVASPDGVDYVASYSFDGNAFTVIGSLPAFDVPPMNVATLFGLGATSNDGKTSVTARFSGIEIRNVPMPGRPIRPDAGPPDAN